MLDQQNTPTMPQSMPTLARTRPLIPAAIPTVMLTLAVALMLATAAGDATAQTRGFPARQGALQPDGCAPRDFTGFSSGLVIGRAQNRAERRWREAIREAGYHGRMFETWQTGNVRHAYCRRDGAIWECFLRVAPCRGTGPARADGHRSRPHPGWETR